MNREQREKLTAAWEDCVSVVGTIFEQGGYLPNQDPKNPKTKPIEIKNLRDEVRHIVEYVAGKHNAWGKDAIHIEDIPEVIQSSVVKMVERAAEPNLVLTNLLTDVPMNPEETFSEQFMGSIVGVADWIGANDEPPVVPPLQTASTVGVRTRKYGLMLNFSNDIIETSRWNVVQLHLEEAAKDMARFKERETARMIFTNADYKIIGNSVNTATVSRWGSVVSGISGYQLSSGRDPVSLAQNDTLTLNDLFDMMAELINYNVFPDTLIMHPFAWSIFARNYEMKEFAILHNQVPFYEKPTGNAQLRRSQEGGFVLPPQENRSNQATLQVAVPNLFPQPLNIIVSPFAYLSTDATKTDIVMAVSGQVGIQLTDPSGVQTSKWEDPLHDMRTIKLTERWNVLPKNEGKYLISAVDIAMAASADPRASLSYTTDPEPQTDPG